VKKPFWEAGRGSCWRYATKQGRYKAFVYRDGNWRIEEYDKIVSHGTSVSKENAQSDAEQEWIRLAGQIDDTREPVPLRIAFVGAQSVGKSTLARYFAKHYQLPLIHEIARQVLSELETNFASLHADLEQTTQYQKEIFDRQIKAQLSQPAGYVSDRAFDNLAYACESADDYASILNNPDFPKYLEHLKDVLVFFVRPHPSLLKDDGVRHSINWDGVVRIDGMIKLLLRTCRVRYFEIDTPILRDRVELVRNVVGRTL